MDLELQQFLQAMETRLKEYTGQRADRTEARLESMDARLESMDARLETMDARLETMQARLGTMDARLETMEARLKAYADIRSETIETRLLRAFRQFAHPVEARLRVDRISITDVYDAEIEVLKERVEALEEKPRDPHPHRIRRTEQQPRGSA